MSRSLTIADLPLLISGETEAAALQRKRDLSGETAANKLPFKLHRGRSAISRPVLSTALFSFSKGLIRLPYTVADPLSLNAYPCEQYGDCVLTYTGEELRQDDQRVLAALIAAHGNREIDALVKANLRDFCHSIGWGRHTTAVNKLLASLIRLHGGALRIKHSRGEISARFIDTCEILEGRMYIGLHRQMLGFYEAGCTYLPMRDYVKMTDGFATWLFGFLRAHTDEVCFDLADIHRASGSKAEFKTFGTMMRRTMQKLENVGCVGAHTFKRGKLLVSWKSKEDVLSEAE